MMMAVQPFRMIFSPAVGGSQKLAKVSKTITVGQSNENRQSVVGRLCAPRKVLPG